MTVAAGQGFAADRASRAGIQAAAVPPADEDLALTRPSLRVATSSGAAGQLFHVLAEALRR